jgi:PKD repeat protein
MIDSVNDAPITNEQVIITLEDTTYIGPLNAFDPDADPLTFGVDTLPLHGSLDLKVGGVFTYTPNLNYNGTDVFTFTVSDGIYSTIGHVDIFVISVNDDPIVGAGDDLNVTEGNLAVFSGSFSDPGLLLEAESIQWYFGDGETVTGTLTPSHIYGDNGIFTVTLVVTDDQGGAGSDWLLVTVENVEPQLDTISNQTVAVGSTLGVTATFNDPGWLDSHTVVIHWGDGISETFVIPAGDVSLDLSHTFTEVGVYSATLTINDDDGAYDFLTFDVTVSPISYSSMLPIVKK